jgi:hypothetical protein
MQKIKTFEDACEALKLNPAKCLPDVSGVPAHHQEAITANAKLIIIVEALNQDWKPNWNNRDEYKLYPWWKVDASSKNPSGSCLSFHGAGRWATNTTVGSRLCFKSEELCEYAANQFKPLYEAAFLLK